MHRDLRGLAIDALDMVRRGEEDGKLVRTVVIKSKDGKEKQVLRESCQYIYADLLPSSPCY
jgi:hypothetical protein